MLIPLKALVQKYNLNIKGIIHVGTSQAEEAESYKQCGVNRQFWVEAVPEIYEKAAQKLKYNKEATIIQACVSEKNFKPVVLNIINNNGLNSSCLMLKNSNIKVERTIEMITLTLDSIFEMSSKNPKFSILNFNFLNLNIQGTELMALQGFKKNLQHIDYIYFEINDTELHNSYYNLTAIDDFLIQHGFRKKECKILNYRENDKFYIKDFLIKQKSN